MRARCLPILIVLLLLCACSTTRVLRPGEYRLARNSVKIRGKESGVTASDLTSYVRQQANSEVLPGWNPSLIIYNWSDPDKNDWFNNALRTIGTAPVVFNGSQVAASRQNIAKHLNYLGYYNSNVISMIDTLDRTVKVTYFVIPGKRCRIDSIAYKIPQGEFEDEFKADMSDFLVKPGDFLSEKSLEAESVRGASYFRNRGYYDFSKYNYFFEADTLGSRNILTYSIRDYSRNETPDNAHPLRKYHIGKVTMEHSAELPFRESILRDVNTLHPGDLYSEAQVNRSYSRLSSLRLFNSVAVEMQPVDSATVDCRITMGEGKIQGFKLNLEASTNASGLLGVSPNVSFFHKNVFHGGEWLTVGFTGNFQWSPGTDTRAMEFGANLGLSMPRFLGLPYKYFNGSVLPRTELNASLNYQNRPEFLRWIGSMSYGCSGQQGNLFYQLYPLRATVIKVQNMSEDFMESLLRNMALWDSFIDHIDAGVGGQLYWTTDTDLVPQGTYSYVRFIFDSSGFLISRFDPILPISEYGAKTLFGLNYSQYVRGEINIGHTHAFSPNTKLAMRLCAGAGYAYGSSSSMPFEKAFYVGGASSMRGWQARELGPGNDELMDFFTIPSQTGEWKLELGAELRQKLFWKIEGAAFAEVGNVWWYDMLDEGWPASLAADWGLGVRLNLNFILLRLDWGAKVYEPSREIGHRFLTPAQWFSSNGCAFHFGVGYPF